MFSFTDGKWSPLYSAYMLCKTSAYMSDHCMDASWSWGRTRTEYRQSVRFWISFIWLLLSRFYFLSIFLSRPLHGACAVYIISGPSLSEVRVNEEAEQWPRTVLRCPQRKYRVKVWGVLCTYYNPAALLFYILHSLLPSPDWWENGYCEGAV